jgi:hypothetical protein
MALLASPMKKPFHAACLIRYCPQNANKVPSERDEWLLIELFQDTRVNVEWGSIESLCLHAIDQRYRWTMEFELNLWVHERYAATLHYVCQYVLDTASKPYSLSSYNCQHFAWEVTQACRIARVPGDNSWLHFSGYLSILASMSNEQQPLIAQLPQDEDDRVQHIVRFDEPPFSRHGWFDMKQWAEMKERNLELASPRSAGCSEPDKRALKVKFWWEGKKLREKWLQVDLAKLKVNNSSPTMAQCQAYVEFHKFHKTHRDLRLSGNPAKGPQHCLTDFMPRCRRSRALSPLPGMEIDVEQSSRVIDAQRLAANKRKSRPGTPVLGSLVTVTL